MGKVRQLIILTKVTTLLILPSTFHTTLSKYYLFNFPIPSSKWILFPDKIHMSDTTHTNRDTHTHKQTHTQTQIHRETHKHTQTQKQTQTQTDSLISDVCCCKWSKETIETQSYHMMLRKWRWNNTKSTDAENLFEISSK